MKAVTVQPGRSGSVRYEEVPEPDESAGSVLVQAVAVGICGTDVEIASGAYGWAPPGRDRLVLGHESLGRVLDPGRDPSLKAGDLVVGIVRRPDPVPCPNCAVGEWDMCRNGQYTERGIKEIDGFMSERWRVEPEYVVKIDPSLGMLGVLLEPTTVVEKGIAQAYEIQRRLRVWRPRKAAVMGAGTIGLLAAMALRLRGLDVTVFGRTARPYLNSDLIEALGARYESTAALPIMEGARKHGPFDLIFEATGASRVVFESMQALGKNGVLVLSSVTGGDQMIQIPADRINLGFVLGNKVMVGTVNANREYFEMGVKDLAHAEAQYPGWLGRLLTHKVHGLENWQQLLDTLTDAKGAIKVYCEIAPI